MCTIHDGEPELARLSRLRKSQIKGLLVVNFREVVHSVRTGNADVAKPQRFAEDRMDTHKNARLTPKGREEMVRAVVDRGMSKAAAARQFNTTPNGGFPVHILVCWRPDCL